MILTVIAYDINTETAAGRKRLRKVAEICEDFGLRMQDSVFECRIDITQQAEVKDRLLDQIDPEQDRLTFYHLGSNWQRRIERHGVKPDFEFGDTLIC